MQNPHLPPRCTHTIDVSKHFGAEPGQLIVQCQQFNTHNTFEPEPRHLGEALFEWYGNDDTPTNVNMFPIRKQL